MSTVSKWIWIVVLAFAFLLLVPMAASAQEEVGGIYGTVTDPQGEPLPSVSVSLAGVGAPRVRTTDALGKFRFLGLDPGSYSLQAKLDGFSAVDYPEIVIRAGRNTTL